MGACISIEEEPVRHTVLTGASAHSLKSSSHSQPVKSPTGSEQPRLPHRSASSPQLAKRSSSGSHRTRGEAVPVSPQPPPPLLSSRQGSQKSLAGSNKGSGRRQSGSLPGSGSTRSSSGSERLESGPVERSSSSKGGGTGNPKAARTSSSGGHGSARSEALRSEEREAILGAVRQFSYGELRAATNKFAEDCKLGEGGFGCVYRGQLTVDGQQTVVAVKVLNQEGRQGEREWLAEVTYLGQLRHPHLVRLLGCCAHGPQRLLAYEFLERGSLERHLFRRSSPPLPWAVRMKVALGAARGLAFLHEEAGRPIIYRDFKASNILVDADFNAKLSDFGLAKEGPVGGHTHVSTRVIGTYGYAAPEYVMTGHLTAKSDVYSFGVVLLELAAGRRAMEPSFPRDQQSLVQWARPYLADPRRVLLLLDPRLGGAYSVRGAAKALAVARACLRQEAKERPLMSDVVRSLEGVQGLEDWAKREEGDAEEGGRGGGEERRKGGR